MIEFEQIQLDFRAKTPLYLQLTGQLRAQIEKGALQADEQLPPVRALAERLRVNFNTVARAYRVLDIEGWLSTQQGRGTYITTQSWPRAFQPAAPAPDFDALPESILVEEDVQEAQSAPGSSAETIVAEPVKPAAAGPGSATPSQEVLVALLAQAANLGISQADLLAYLPPAEAGKPAQNKPFPLATRRTQKTTRLHRVPPPYTMRAKMVSALSSARQARRTKKRNAVQ